MYLSSTVTLKKRIDVVFNGSGWDLVSLGNGCAIWRWCTSPFGSAINFSHALGSLTSQDDGGAGGGYEELFFFWMLTATFHRPLWFGKVSAFCFMDPNPPKSPPALKIKLKVFFGFQKPHTYIKFIAALVFPKPLSLRSGYPVLPSGTTHDLCGACFVDLFQWLVSCLLSLPAIWWSILKSLSVPSHSRNGTHSFENFSRSANCGPRRRVPFLHLMAKSQKRIWSSFQWIILL